MLVEDYFTDDELEPIKRDLEIEVNNLTEGLYAAGKLKGMNWSVKAFIPGRDLRVNASYLSQSCALSTGLELATVLFYPQDIDIQPFDPCLTVGSRSSLGWRLCNSPSF